MAIDDEAAAAAATAAATAAMMRDGDDAMLFDVGAAMFFADAATCENATHLKRNGWFWVSWALIFLLFSLAFLSFLLSIIDI